MLGSGKSGIGSESIGNERKRVERYGLKGLRVSDRNQIGTEAEGAEKSGIRSECDRKWSEIRGK